MTPQIAKILLVMWLVIALIWAAQVIGGTRVITQPPDAMFWANVIANAFARIVFVWLIYPMSKVEGPLRTSYRLLAASIALGVPGRLYGLVSPVVELAAALIVAGLVSLAAIIHAKAYMSGPR